MPYAWEASGGCQVPVFLRVARAIEASRSLGRSFALGGPPAVPKRHRGVSASNRDGALVVFISQCGIGRAERQFEADANVFGRGVPI
jgi:hypothetical protein